jgi:hypothetical protein
VDVNVVAGRTTKATVRYGAIVNPAVARLPHHVRSLVGDPRNPRAVVLPPGNKPGVGTIYTSAPSTDTPYGLVAKVTDVREKPHAVVADLRSVPITEAAPSLDYTGALELTPAPGASADLGDAPADATPRVHAAADACKPPKLLKFHAHLDSVQVREASLSAWPPQLRLQFAVRTTESLGVAAAAVGINCDWTLGEIGPFQGAIPVGPLVIPVFATVPVKAGIHLNGRLDVGTVNVASTTVASVASGVRANEASLSQQGSNVWLSGSPSLSGSAKLYANVGVVAGIGIAKGANLHLQASFGPEFNWASGQSCTLALKFSGLQAGLSVFGKNFNTPGFKPWQLPIWSGCSGGGETPGSGGGGTTTSPGGGTTTPPGGGGTTTPPGGGGTTTPPGGGGSPPPAGASISASQGGQYGCSNCSALNIQVHNFPTGTYTYYCHDNSGPGGSDTVFYSHAVSVTDPNQGTWPGVFCDDNAPYRHISSWTGCSRTPSRSPTQPSHPRLRQPPPFLPRRGVTTDAAIASL